MTTAHINIGTNLGDRQANLRQAVAGISAITGVTAIRVSKIVESAPWGYESQAPFLNIGVAVETILDPFSLFEALQGVEKQISCTPHRDRNGNYIDRIIDIDLIAYGEQMINTPKLIIPHPRMHLRPFVLFPLAELAPEWTHPILHLTPSLLLEVIK